MRFTLVVVTLATVASSATAQTRLDAVISQGRSRASVEVVLTEPYGGGPWASVPAARLTESSNLAAKGFRIRTWNEDGRARVVVFAVQLDDREKESETQIATFLLRVGESRNVTQTEQHGAAHVLVTAVARP
jgi:hypothetical protein